MRANREVSKKERADFKRLTEICIADPERRNVFLRDPAGCMKKWGLEADPQLAAEGIEAFLGDRTEARDTNPYILALREIIAQVHKNYEREMGTEHIANELFRAWYERRTAGYGFQSRASRHNAGLFYIPVSFELSDGCSVGCPFCCLAAKPLKKNFLYTQESGTLWRQVLRITEEEIGPIVRMSVCYFATEPFDNPGYEQFLQDFYRIFGRYPQTTTALLERDTERSRNFLRLLGDEALADAALRSSVLSLAQLEKIHREFSSEELEYVELLPNNPESVYSYSHAGRSLVLSKTLKTKTFTDRFSSICICGFVVNLPKQTVMLVAPHVPDEKHPLGMRVYDRREFNSPEEYRQLLREMMNARMPVLMPEDRPMQIEAPLSWERKGYVLKVQGDGISRSISLSDDEYECFTQMMERQISLKDVFERKQLDQFQRRQMVKKMRILYNAGCLEEVSI